MKRFGLICCFALVTLTLLAQPSLQNKIQSIQDLEYFFSVKNGKYNPTIPTPSSYLGYNIGERFVEWGDVLRYADELSKASDRVSFKTFGKTIEGRPFIQIYITSPANQTRLEAIRQEHLKATDCKTSASLDLSKMPIVIDLMGSIHGNEASGVNALVPLMYFYAACENPEIKDMLDNAVLIFTPGQNPDGLNRFATLANVYSSYNPYIQSEYVKEHNLPWPSQRSNHYWMDVNRDWLTAQMPEGKNLVTMYEYWMPNVVLDLHEQGSGRSGEYYFSPGDANRTHYCIPQKNQDLTLKISRYTKQAIDSVGVSNFSQKGYDDFFIGKGACYGDVQGSVCILHEQTGTYGHIRKLKKWGTRLFPEAVRNQSIATMAVVQGSYDNRDEIKEYQRDFYIQSDQDAAANPNKGYTFSARGNRGIAFHFIENLLLHEIDVYPVIDKTYTWFVPFNQRHYKKLKTIFDDITEYTCDTFYDVSTWGPVYGYNLQRELVSHSPAVGEKITQNTFPQGTINGGQTTCAYAFNLAEYYTPRLMAALQSKNIKLKVATNSFNYRYKAGKVKKTFPAGTVIVPVEGQPLSAQDLHNAIAEQATKCGIDIEALQVDKKKGFDLTTVALDTVRVPKTIIATDIGAANTIGEMWYLLDYRYNMKHYLINFSNLGNPNFAFEQYNVVILCGKLPSASKEPATYKRLEQWVKNGGTLILQQSAYEALENLSLPHITCNSATGVAGLVLLAQVMQAQSPLLWGYDQDQIPFYKNIASTYTLPEQATAVLSWAQEPYLTGYVSTENLAKIKGTPILATMPIGKGRIVFTAENLNFRSYWYATSHIITNAVFFGHLL